MIVHDVKQGSDEWRELRAAKPTASNFGNIITAVTMKVSASSHPYMCTLIAEHLIGPMEETDTKFMQRGTALETVAIHYYEFMASKRSHKVKVERVGFVTNDEGTVGGSPDGLVGEEGGLEIKCRGAGKHVAGLLGRYTQDLPQIQGLMWLTERTWWDLLYYNPEIPPAITRITRDEEYISRLKAALDVFVPTLAQKRDEVVEMLNWRPVEVQRAEPS